METQKPSTSSDEIDLGQLFSKIGDFFNSIGLALMRFLSLVRRVPIDNKLTFLILIPVSLVIGFSYSKFVKRKFYEATMILNSDYLNKRLVDNTIEKLNLLAMEKDKSGLAKALKIPDTLANNIYEFSAKPFVEETELIELEVLKEQLKSVQKDDKNGPVIDQVIKRIEIENRHSFEITLRIYSHSVVKDLQSALVNYFKNNDFIRKRIEIHKSNLIEIKTKLFRDTQKLDSLKFIIYDNYRNMAAQSRQGSNNVILSDKAVTNPIDIYNQDLALYNQFQSVNAQIYLQQDFEVVDGFVELTEPSSPHLIFVMGISLLLGILISYLFVALAAFNKYLARLS